MRFFVAAVVGCGLSMVGCGESHPAARRCVDETGTVDDNAKCEAAPAGAGTERPAHKYAWVYTPPDKKE